MEEQHTRDNGPDRLNDDPVWTMLAELPAPLADSARMRIRFEEALGQARPSWRDHPWFQAAAAVVILAAGITAGRLSVGSPAPPEADTSIAVLREEIRDMRQMVTLSLLQQQSAAERLRGVNWTGEIEHPDDAVVTALLDTLRHDTNVNVRLAAIDALRRFADRPDIRRAAIDSLPTQTSPLIQMALIDFVVEADDQQGAPLLRQLSTNPDTDNAVRERARWGLSQILG